MVLISRAIMPPHSGSISGWPVAGSIIPPRIAPSSPASSVTTLGPEALAEWTVIADSALDVGALLLEGPDGAVRDGPADWRRAIAAAVRG